MRIPYHMVVTWLMCLPSIVNADSIRDLEEMIGAKPTTAHPAQRMPDAYDIAETTMVEFEASYPTNAKQVAPRTLSMGNLMVGEVFRQSIEIEDVSCKVAGTLRYRCTYVQHVITTPTKEDLFSKLVIALTPKEDSKRVVHDYWLKNGRWESPTLRQQYADMKAAAARATSYSSGSSSGSQSNCIRGAHMMNMNELAGASLVGGVICP